MLAICVECSHQRGMGNLFRSLNIAHWLDEHGIKYIFLINDDQKSLAYLNKRAIEYEVVDLWDYDSNWEKVCIGKYHINRWINDRMATDARHAAHVKNCGVKLCTFDDTGGGAAYADQNFCPMVLERQDRLEGKEVFSGSAYMILNPEISLYRRARKEKKRILITLGGSDTYGVSVQVVDAVKRLPYDFTVVTGYCFGHEAELEQAALDSKVQIIRTVPSMMEYFSHFDMAITGGGVTPFEAIASGLPCVIVANEHHEEQVGRFFAKSGCAAYLGYYQDAAYSRLGEYLRNSNVSAMSARALDLLKMDGLENVMTEIMR